jgi:hypothetical protein
VQSRRRHLETSLIRPLQEHIHESFVLDASDQRRLPFLNYADGFYKMMLFLFPLKL